MRTVVPFVCLGTDPRIAKRKHSCSSCAPTVLWLSRRRGVLARVWVFRVSCRSSPLGGCRSWSWALVLLACVSLALVCGLLLFSPFSEGADPTTGLLLQVSSSMFWDFGSLPHMVVYVVTDRWLAIAGPPGRQYWEADCLPLPTTIAFQSRRQVAYMVMCFGRCTRWLVLYFQTGFEIVVLFSTRCRGSHYLRPRRCGDVWACCCGTGQLNILRHGYDLPSKLLREALYVVTVVFGVLLSLLAQSRRLATTLQVSPVVDAASATFRCLTKLDPPLDRESAYWLRVSSPCLSPSEQTFFFPVRRCRSGLVLERATVRRVRHRRPPFVLRVALPIHVARRAPRILSARLLCVFVSKCSFTDSSDKLSSPELRPREKVHVVSKTEKSDFDQMDQVRSLWEQRKSSYCQACLRYTSWSSCRQVHCRMLPLVRPTGYCAQTRD